MKKELLMDEENARALLSNPLILQGLLHERWRLKESETLSLFPTENAITILVSSEEECQERSTAQDVLDASFRILSEGLRTEP